MSADDQASDPGTTEAVEADSEKETTRLEAFSDGVFAIAITLLVLEVKVPHDLPAGETLLEALVEQWPSYVAFVTSFATIGIMWINHHRMFTHIGRTDYGLLLANGLVLLGVTFVPFPTAVLAEHHNEKVAAMLYSATFSLNAVFFQILWRRGRRLLRRNVDAASVRAIGKQNALGPPLYIVCLGLAFFSVFASIAANLAVAIFIALRARHAN